MKQLAKWFHNHSHDLQVLTNLFTIAGVIVALVQISGTKEIITAIFQSQEKNASYRLEAMESEIRTNLQTIDKVLKAKDVFVKTGQILQTPLSIDVYFSSPTAFKMERLDKTANHKLNQGIARVYVQWQISNHLIQSNMDLANGTLDGFSKKVVLSSNCGRIVRIFEETRTIAEEILKAIQAEPSPI